MLRRDWPAWGPRHLWHVRAALALTALAVTLDATTVQAQAGQTTVSVSSLTLNPGATGQVSVTMSNIPASGLAGYNLTISYNPSVVTVGGVQGGASPFDAPPTSNINNCTGSVVIATAVVAGPTSGSVEVARLNVQAVGSAGASTTLTVTVTELIDNSLSEITPRTGVNGSVTIAGGAPEPPTPPPPSPTGLQCTPGSGQATLTWNPATGATSYVVYMATVIWSTWSPGLPGAMRHDGIAQATFLHTGLTNGTAYYFAVAAVGPGGASSPSTPINCTPSVAPTAAAKQVSTVQAKAVTVTLTGADPETCELTFSIVQAPSNGTLGTISNKTCVAAVPNLDSAQVTYVPDGGFTGSDSFVYRVSDGTQSATATVQVSMRPLTVPGVSHLELGALAGLLVMGLTWAVWQRRALGDIKQ